MVWRARDVSSRTVCPDTAIPGLVTEIGPAVDTVLRRLWQRGEAVEHLPKAVPVMARLLRQALSAARESDWARRRRDVAAVSRRGLTCGRSRTRMYT